LASPSLRARAQSSASTHPWLPRALILIWLGWVWLAFLGAEPPSYLRNPFGALTLIVHEAGHAAFMWSGSRLLTVAGGTVFQIAIPALVAWLFWRRNDVFGVTVAAFWLGTSLVDAGIYAADARAQVLPRVSPWGGEDDVFAHDWTYLLMRFGMLSRDEAVGGRLRAAGMALMVAALAAGVWTVWVMRGAARGERSEPALVEEAAGR
jgi:hypothetical protein